MNARTCFFLSALLVIVVLCFCSAPPAQAQTGAAGGTQATAPAPECTDAVDCATDCEKGVGASCYKLAQMYYNGSSGVPKDPQHAVTYYLKACDHGYAKGCGDAGWAYGTGFGVTRDYARAADLYKKGCDGGYFQSCSNLGLYYRGGLGVTKNLDTAAKLFAKACDASTSYGCTNLGRAYEHGEAVAKDASKAATLYRQGCDLGDPAGCYDLGLLYRDGSGNVAKDLKAAVPLLKRACDAGHADGCNDLGVVYEEAEGVEKNDLRATSLYQKACDGDSSYGCFNLGRNYRDGRGVDKDAVRAATLFQKGCDLNNAGACNELGLAYDYGRGVMKDEAQALKFYEKSCEGKYATGCTNVGYMYRDGRGVPEDQARAAEAFKQSCDVQDTNGCFGLGYAYEMGQGVPVDKARAAELYKKACDGKIAAACNNLGTLYRDGQGVAKDEVKGAQLFKIACEAGNGYGCNNLGNAYEYARGVDMDESKAADFYQKGCQASNEAACNNYKRLAQENPAVTRGQTPSGAQANASAGGERAGIPQGGPSTPIAAKVDRWAMIVGISAYGSGVASLRYARKDAEAFYSFLRSPAGGSVPEDHILLLLDQEATSARVRGGLRDFLGKAGKTDQVMIFFAGHGSPDPNHPNALYLLTYDAVPDRLGETAFDMNEIRSALQETISAERIIAFVDACHSGGISSLDRRAAAISNEQLNLFLKSLATSGSGVAMFSASQSNETSREGDQWGGGHGVFTYFLIEGMKGAADLNHDGIVTMQELADYVTDQVKTVTNYGQHPKLETSSNWDPNTPVAVVPKQ